MDFSIIKARVKRNQLEVLAGENFRDESSQIVQTLNKKNKKAYLGIQNNNGLYTILGESSSYILTKARVELEIKHSNFWKILQEHAMNKGKESTFEFIPISEKEYAWVKDTATMCALWNTLLLLDK